MSSSVPQTAVHRAQAAGWVNRQIATILITQVVFGFGWSLYLLTPKFLASALHAGPDIIGLTSAAGGLAGVMTVPFAAWGLDRLGRRLFFRIAAALIVLLSLGFLQVSEVSWLVFVLQGCVAAAFVLAFNSTATLIADWAPPERMGQVIGWLGGANVLMNAVATMIAEPLAMRYGWHVVFELGVVAGCAAFALSLLLQEPAPRSRAGAESAPEPAARSRGALLPILVAAALVGGVFSAIFSFVQPYALSLGAQEVRDFFLGFTASAVLARVVFGSLGDRFGRRTVSAWMIAGYALCSFLTMRLDPERLALYGLAFGAAHGLLYPTMSALVLEVGSAARRGLGMVLFNGAFNVGTTVSSLLWGVLAKRYGYPSVYATATALALVATIVMVLAGRGQGRERS